MIPHPFRRLITSPARFCVLFYGIVWILIVAAHYPFHSDAIESPRTAMNQPAQAFYEEAYVGNDAQNEDEADDIYVQTAKKMAELFGIKQAVEAFAADHQLSRKKVLEVGAGRGYLQDIVEDYTGLDISPTARRYFHKPFVQASATDMPFRDETFDAIWTIWVLEHVPNPEQALSEMRRVLKDDGILYLAPAWRCTPWAADGYAVRPYGDLSLAGKLVKASLPIRTSPLFQMMYLYPVRLIRKVETKFAGADSRFRYKQLTPNYQKYWVPDSDAVNSMDRFDAMLWFTDRGDECLNCGAFWDQIRSFSGPLVIRVHKQIKPSDQKGKQFSGFKYARPVPTSARTIIR